MNDLESRFDEALRHLAARPAPTPAPFAAARVVARLSPSRPVGLGLRPWLAAAAFSALGLALRFPLAIPTLPPPVPAPVAPGVVVFPLDSETTLYFALPESPGNAGEESS